MPTPGGGSSTSTIAAVTTADSCKWVKFDTSSGFSSADENIYTTTITTDSSISNCQLSWFVIGSPQDSSNPAPLCAAGMPTGGKPLYSDVTDSKTFCMSAGKSQYMGFFTNCSNTPLQATVTVSMEEFCDKDKQTVWRIILWVVIAVIVLAIGLGIYCCCRCCRKKEEDPKGEDTLWIVQPNMAVGVEPNQPGGHVFVNMATKEDSNDPDDGVQDFGVRDEDERRRLKAAKYERLKEEKRAARIRAESSKQQAEMEEWERNAEMREAEEREWAEDQERRRAEAEASNAQNAEATKNLLAEAQQEISEIIEEAYQLPPEDRKQKIKELRLRWHPDKNPMLKSLATDIMKIINHEIEKQNK